jgi:PAS domain S-box-containing protein
VPKFAASPRAGRGSFVTTTANAAMAGSYNYLQVALSALLAVSASYVALDLAGRVTAASGRTRLAWMTGGSAAMGMGIWAMHYVAMLAFRLPIPVGYYWPTVMGSLLTGILSSAFALYVVSRQRMGPVQALTGSLIMGGGIAALHYIGMAAMRLAAVCRFSPLLVSLSIVLAILFSLGALLLAFDLREGTRGTVLRKIGSAAVMGAAISAMHYTAMAAARFSPSAVPPDLSHTVNISALGTVGIAIVTLLVLALAVLTCESDRRLAAQAAELERHVIERTSQLTAVNEKLVESEAEAKARAEELAVILDAVPGMTLISRDPACHRMTGSRVAYELVRLPYGANLSKSAPEGERPFNFRVMKEGRELPPSELPMQKAAATGQEVRESEFTLLFDDGTSHDMFGNAVPLLDQEGKVRGAVGVFADITERKQAEAAMRESEDRYRDLVEHSQDLLCTHDLEGELLSCNPAPARILGYEVSELLKIPMRELIAPEFREQFDAYLARIKVVGADAGLMAVVTRTGERRIWEYNNTLRTEGVPSPIVRGMARDITERKRAEMALRRSEENYRNFVAQSSEGIFRQDLDAPIPVDLPEDELVHHILHDSYLAECNDAIVKMYGFRSQQEFLGKRLTETLDPNEPRNIELTREYIRSGFRVLERESHEVDVLGNPKVFLNSMIGIVENGKLVRTWGIQRDITERVRLEEARKQAEAALREAQAELARVTRIAAMGELTASIAHEINQPLTAVFANASAALRWLAAQPPDLDDAREAMTSAMQEANRASRVIERIRTLLKKAPPEMRRLDVNEVIREVLALTANELLGADVAVRTELAADVPAVLGDRVQLQQVVLNLVMNAIDAMGMVTDRPRVLLVKSSKHPDGALIQVQDSGRGIDPDQADRIFEPFLLPSPKELEWDCPSAAPLWKLMAAVSGPAPGLPTEQFFNSLCQRQAVQHE